MIERLLITVGIMALLAMSILFTGTIQKSKVRKEASRYAHTFTPTLLYFWSEACVPCKLVQTPALDELETQATPIEIVRVNALEEPELASKWGVMTVPTTILLDREGQPAHINNRAVRLPELKRQLGDLGVAFS